MRTLETVLLGGRRGPLETGAPATLAEFIRVDEVFRRLAAFGTFQRHEPCHSANLQAMCTGAPLNPLAEFRCQVLLVHWARVFTCKKKWPRTKQHHHACRYYDCQEQCDHMTIPPGV